MPIASASSLTFGCTDETLIAVSSSEVSTTAEVAEAVNGAGQVFGFSAHGKKQAASVEGLTLGDPSTLQALVGTVTPFESLDDDIPDFVVEDVTVSKSATDFRKVKVSGKASPNVTL